MAKFHIKIELEKIFELLNVWGYEVCWRGRGD